LPTTLNAQAHMMDPDWLSKVFTSSAG